MNYEDTRAGYANLWKMIDIRPERTAAALVIARRLERDRKRYQAVADQVGCPWWWVAITHQMESGARFDRHMHNGDPLTARTVNIPAGRPATGNPPFTWETSAIDALKTVKNLDRVPSWEIPRALYEFERYNGFGYFGKGINSPYLWSYSTLYDAGKYVADGKYDPNAVSRQCGAAVILRSMMDNGIVDSPDKETEPMVKLLDELKPFADLAPVLVGIVAGPKAALAVRALAEVLETDADADQVAAKLNKEPVSAAGQKVAAAEEIVRPIVEPQLPVPTTTTAPTTDDVPAGSIDNMLGGEWLKGKKTLIGGAVFMAVQIAAIIWPDFFTPEIYQVLSWVSGGLGFAGLAGKFERLVKAAVVKA